MPTAHEQNKAVFHSRLWLALALFICVSSVFVVLRGLHASDRKAIQTVYDLGGVAHTDDGVPIWLAAWLAEFDMNYFERVREVEFWQTAFISRRKSTHDVRVFVPLTSDIGDNELGLLIRDLMWLKKFRNLILSGTRITDDGVRQIAQLSDLTYLNLSGTRISNAGLAHIGTMHKLERLNLWVTEISDEGLEKLDTLSSLRSLNLEDTYVTPEGIAKLKMALPKLRVSSDFDSTK